MPPDYAGAACRSRARSLPQDPVLDRVLAREMKLNVGLGRRFSVDQVAEALEIAPRKVRGIRDGEQRAGLDLGLRIAALLGPGSLNRMLLAVGYVARPIEETNAEASAHALLADLGEEVASLSRKLEDGRLDHRERLQLERELSDLQARIEAVRASMGVETA